MTPKADLTVISSNGDIALVVEVKVKVSATDEWAATLRRNLVVHGIVPASAYFLLALPDYFFLWKPFSSPEAVDADYKIPAGNLVKMYLEDIHLEELSSSSLELLLSAWVSNLIESNITGETEPELAWLIDSGLFESIKGGSIQAQPAL